MVISKAGQLSVPVSKIIVYKYESGDLGCRIKVNLFHDILHSFLPGSVLSLKRFKQTRRSYKVVWGLGFGVWGLGFGVWAKEHHN